MGVLEGSQLHRHVVVIEVFSLVIEPLAGKAGERDVEDFLEHVARFFRIHVVEVELEGRHPTPDTVLEPAIAQLIDDRYFLDQAKR